MVLLFDEADSLFGKRTDVKDANDRFANQQTNYLLQRIESHDGIVVLTSNSRARFDPAFTRRLDAILDFPAPGPEERRALWLAHLGDAHTLDAAALNRIAAACDLAGGHIRNVVLAAAARTRAHDRRIGEAELLAALAAEYRKLGKALPSGTEAPHPEPTTRNPDHELQGTAQPRAFRDAQGHDRIDLRRRQRDATLPAHRTRPCQRPPPPERSRRT